MPVIALTGHLGAGKTTLLNHLLRQPGARIGVVINDFGEVNVDAGLVSGQIDDPASIAGGCLCCIEDASGLDEALARLSHPRLALDAVIVEASGIAEPGALAKLIRYSEVPRVRLGGVIDVVDAVHYFETIDGGGVPPARFDIASLVVLNRIDQLDPATRDATLARIEARVRERTTRATVLPTSRGRIDPALVYDVASTDDPEDELPIARLLREDAPAPGHLHASSVTVRATAPVSPDRLAALLEDPPSGAFRMKGRLAVRTERGVRDFVVHLVGRSTHVTEQPVGDSTGPGPEADHGELVAVGLDLDADLVTRRLEHALAPDHVCTHTADSAVCADGVAAVTTPAPDVAGLRRLRRHRA